MLLLERRNPHPVVRVRETAKARRESAAGTGKGAQQIMGWSRLAGTSGGLLAPPGPRAVSCCATLWDVTVSYIVLCDAVRITLFSLYSLLSSERVMT